MSSLGSSRSMTSKWIGMSRATIYRLRQRNRFPIRPLSPTTRRVQFAGIDVLRYLLRNRE
jgi:predicted DNA-binding transcriptional regulator AlpA